MIRGPKSLSLDLHCTKSFVPACSTHSRPRASWKTLPVLFVKTVFLELFRIASMNRFACGFTEFCGTTQQRAGSTKCRSKKIKINKLEGSHSHTDYDSKDPHTPENINEAPATRRITRDRGTRMEMRTPTTSSRDLLRGFHALTISCLVST